MATPEPTRAAPSPDSDESMGTTSSESLSSSIEEAENGSEHTDSGDSQDGELSTLIEPNGEPQDAVSILSGAIVTQNMPCGISIGYTSSTCGYCSSGNRETAEYTSRSYGSAWN